MAEWLRKLLRIEPGISLAQWTYDRISNNWDRLLAAFVAAGGMSYFGSISEAIAAWGPGGIWAAGVLLGLATWIGLSWAASLKAHARLRRAQATATEDWRQRVGDSVNPLSPEFHTKRLRIADIAHPINRRIENKRFIDCELIGPANLLPLGVDIRGMEFINCDCVVVRNGVPIRNAVGLKNVTLLGGKIWQCTFLVPQKDIPQFVAMGATFVSPTGLSEIDSQSPPDTQEKTQP